MPRSVKLYMKTVFAIPGAETMLSTPHSNLDFNEHTQNCLPAWEDEPVQGGRHCVVQH